MRRIGECKRCGACCHYVHQMAVLDEEGLEFWKARGVTLIPDGDAYFLLSDAACRHLQKNEDGTTTCDIWENRPMACRKWPNPSVMYDLIKKYLGCGYDFVDGSGYTEERSEIEMRPGDWPKHSDEQFDALLKAFGEAKDELRRLKNERG